MKKRLYSGAIFIAILVLAFVLKATVHNYFFDAAILFIACVASLEASKIFAKMGKYNHKILALIQPVFMMLALLLCLLYQRTLGLVYTIIIAVGVIVLFFLISFFTSLIMFKKTKAEIETRELEHKLAKFSLIKALNTAVTFVYPSFMIMFLTLINHFEDMTASFGSFGGFGEKISLFVLILAFLIPIFSDTFAYLVGGLFGGKKLAPKISPNKTISGAVGGLFFCILLSIVTFFIFNSIPSMQVALASGGINVWKVAIISMIGSVLGQLGDLFESYLKRSAGVKDSGKIMPGHGGILDRFDSHLFVAPFVFIAFCILFAVI